MNCWTFCNQNAVSCSRSLVKFEEFGLLFECQFYNRASDLSMYLFAFTINMFLAAGLFAPKPYMLMHYNQNECYWSSLLKTYQGLAGRVYTIFVSKASLCLYSLQELIIPRIYKWYYTNQLDRHVCIFMCVRWPCWKRRRRIHGTERKPS